MRKISGRERYRNQTNNLGDESFMIKNVVEVKLPVGEALSIQKNRIVGTAGESDKRICIVTGTHGDELEGQYVAWELAHILSNKKDKMCGTVDIYPALNPLGISTIYRGLPQFDLDMNRIFPGTKDETMQEFVANAIVEDIAGASLCVDIHASNIFLRELPQIRINDITADKLVPMAQRLNMDFVWVHSAATVLESTLAYSLNALDTPTLVVEMGVGMRITKKYGDQLIAGILYTMNEMGMLLEPVAPVAPPIVSTDGHVGFVNANSSGIFIPYVSFEDRVAAGQLIGVVANPLTGEIEEELTSPLSGLLFTLREYPVVYSGSLIARVLGGAR